MPWGSGETGCDPCMLFANLVHLSWLTSLQAKRDAMFFHDWACISYFLDPRFKGAGLPASKKRSVVTIICDTAWATLCPTIPTPLPEELVFWLEGREPYIVPSCIASRLLFEFFAKRRQFGSMNPQAFWELYRDTPLFPFASIVSMLPCTTSDIERVWSVAGDVVSGRERLTIENAAEEVYIRWNRFALP